MGRRRVGEVIADHLHANGQRAQARVVESAQLQPIGRARDEYVRRAVVRTRRRKHLEVARHPEDDVAQTCLECFANIPAPLRPPYVSEMCVELVRNQACELILEALLASIRERQIVRIRAHLQLTHLRPRARRRCSVCWTNQGCATDGEDYA
jgi:hypothetical protein